MDLAFALFRYFPYGGLQRDMVAIAREALDRGHRVTVYTREWQGAIPSGVQVQELPASGMSNHGRDRQFVADLSALAVHHDSWVGFNKMPGLDWYYAADGCLAARYDGSLKRLLPRYRGKLAMERAVFSPDARTNILSISPPQKVLFQRHYGTPAERFHELPPGIRHDRVVPPDYDERRKRQRSALSIGDHQRVCLFVGSGFRTKGLERAIAAFAASSAEDPLFYVVGSDREAPYRRLARRLGVADRVHFVGGQDNIPEWLWAADLLLHPAHAENTGTVLLEAAVAGLPVVTTDACGYAPWILSSAMGEVLASAQFSVSAMAEAMDRLLAQPRSDWLERARAFAASADIFSLVSHAVDAITAEDRV